MIDITLFNIVGLSILGVMIAFWYQPIQTTKTKILSKLPFLLRVFECSKCTSFVLGLIIFQNLLAAALCAFIGYVIGFIINYIENWYE